MVSILTAKMMIQTAVKVDQTKTRRSRLFLVSEENKPADKIPNYNHIRYGSDLKSTTK